MADGACAASGATVGAIENSSDIGRAKRMIVWCNGGRRAPDKRQRRSPEIAAGSAARAAPSDYAAAAVRPLARSAMMKSEARKPIIIAGPLVLPETIVGMIEVSATRSPCTPRRSR